MPVFSPIKINASNKVRHYDYIRTENKPDEADKKPAEPTTTPTPETK